jgi:hypothetical protein
MPSAVEQQAQEDGSAADLPPLRATVFGLDLHAAGELRLLSESSAAATGRALALTLAGDEAACGWPRGAELVCDQREADGSVSFRIEFDPDAGYLIEGPGYGRHILSGDGRRVVSMPGGRAAEVWQRLLIAQVLPFAALIRGLEVLHASAVVSEHGALVLAGPSRAGKTTLALELCRRGTEFLTDDVLALQSAAQRLLGHPGAPLAGVAHAEARRLESIGAPIGGPVLAVNARERLLRVRAAAAPAEVAALFFLERRGGEPGTARFEPVSDPRMLLASTFNTVLRTPARLRSLLELCAQAATLRVERIRIGPGTSVEQVAEAIERRIGTAP